MSSQPIDPRLVAALVVWLLAMATGAMLILAFVTIPKENGTLFTTLVTSLVVGGLLTFIGYLWGSSKGSQSKDDVISNLAQKGDGQ